MEQQELFAVQDSFSGKTSRDASPPRTDETLLQWLEAWLGASSTYRLMDGAMPALLSGRTGWSSGVCWTRDSSEFRSGAVVCSLSSILETGAVERRYFLSAKACRGILNRAERRGKTLPVHLKRALEQAARPGEPTS